MNTIVTTILRLIALVRGTSTAQVVIDGAALVDEALGQFDTIVETLKVAVNQLDDAAEQKRADIARATAEFNTLVTTRENQIAADVAKAAQARRAADNIKNLLGS